MTNKNSKIILHFALSFCILIFTFCIFNKAEAAQLNLTSQAQEFAPGQRFQVDLMLDTEEEVINAIEGEITFPKELLEIREIRDGDSIINLWVEKAHLRNDEIIFSGIIPGGFEGVLGPYHQGYKPGKILSLIFQTKKEGNGIIDLKNAKVLLNDGFGTASQTSITPFTFEITPLAEFTPSEITKDNEIPEDFKPEIASDPNIFDGKWFLVFATQDKGSGIDHYEIHETTRKKDITRISTKKWIEAESPYLLKDQKLRSFVYVKAVDKSGNERIAVVEPRYPIKWYEQPLIWVIIILAVIVAFTIVKLIKSKIKYQKLK